MAFTGPLHIKYVRAESTEFQDIAVTLTRALYPWAPLSLDEDPLLNTFFLPRYTSE